MIMIGENYKVGTIKLNIVVYQKFEADPERVERGKALSRYRHGGNINPVEIVEEDDGEDKAEKGWKVVGYFRDISNALNYIVNLEIERSELRDIQTVVDMVNKTSEDIKVALSQIPKESLEKAMS